MEQKEFVNIIRAYRHRLNLAGFLKKLVFSLGVGAGAGILFQAAAFFTPFYGANVYTAVSMLLAIAAAAAAALVRRVTMEQAALTMDSFGFQERIITAYEHREDDGALFALQRKDAMDRLKEHRNRIRIPLWPDRKKTILSALLLAAAVGLAIVPSPMKERAKELHQVQKEAVAKEEEIEEVLEELEELEQQTLTPEQLASLQEMTEGLQSSLAEYGQAVSADELQAANDKLRYKYDAMSGQIADLAQSLQNGASVSPITAESMQAMADKLQEMSGKSADGDKVASGQEGSQGDGQESGQGGSQGDGQEGSQGSGQGDGQGGSQGDGQEGGQGSGQGDGQGGSQGDGQSGSQGDGQGGGQGDGQSGGAGRGTGTANNSHDYVSIPNAVADSGNLTGNAVNHDNSDYFRAPNGLSWEGTHISYEAVIGSYEQNAYEGIATGRYPSGMESVIKDYFASFN